MSYQPQALGLDLFKKGPAVLRAGAKILEDPYLPEVACEVMRLSDIEGGKPAGARCPPTRVTAKMKKGVGLRYAVKPLRALIFHKQNPWVVPVVLLGTLGAIFYLGYTMGKKS